MLACDHWRTKERRFVYCLVRIRSEYVCKNRFACCCCHYYLPCCEVGDGFMKHSVKHILVKDQTGFCCELMLKLSDSVSIWSDAGCPDLCESGKQLKENGATKTQIKNDVVRLRRELSILARMVD